MKKKIIIDTDCGSDDAMAIAMALNDEKFEVLLFTTVSGNVNAKQASFNLLTTIHKVNAYYPPVYIGESEMINRDWVGAHGTHGQDGMGDIGLIDYNLKANGDNGVDKLLEVLKENDDKTIDIIAIGPLTNIARAIQKDINTMHRVNRIVTMATTGFTYGNITDYAEFNVWQDPDAFDIVANSGLDVYVVGWDACLEDAVLDEKDIKEIYDLNDLGKYLIDCNKDLLKLNIERFQIPCLDMADPAAIAFALYPDCIEILKKYHCEVCLDKDDVHYGQVLFDNEEKENVYLCNQLDGLKYKEYLKKMIKKSR